jgi:thiamine transport system ATP-binding protein
MSAADTAARGERGLDVRDVTVRFGPRTVLDHVSLHVEPAETVAVLGPSGSGKSTLLRVIAGILPADGGAVALDGHDLTVVPAHRRSIGMVFQDQQLFPHLDVRHNIAFGLRMQRATQRDIDARVDELLQLIGLEGFGGRRIDDLSGGEATRVALARSLAPRPRVLLLDEPLTGLDRDLHDRLALELRHILAGTTTVLVTHDPEEARVVATRQVLMDDLAHSPR